MCVGIATVKRPGQEQHVRATVGSLLEGLSDAERAEVYLIVFIVNTNPSVHPIYHEPWLSAVVNKVLTYNISAEDMNQLRKFEDDGMPRNISLYDYGVILQDCFDTNADWIAIIEDDVIARASWYKEVRMSLQTVQAQAQNVSWLYLRMFYTKIFFGYVSEHWSRYLSASSASFLLLLAVLVMSRS